MIKLTWADIDGCASHAWERMARISTGPIFGIPRGGINAAQTLVPYGAVLTSDPDLAAWIVDDIFDSGKTMYQWRGNRLTAALITKGTDRRDALSLDAYGLIVGTDNWVEFPWETAEHLDRLPSSGPEDAVRRLIQFLGEDPDSEAFRETPRRVLDFYSELTATQNGNFNATSFAATYDHLVIQRDIQFYSLCPHHLMPYGGTALVGYVPEGNVIGLSKLARIVQRQAARPSMQEELTNSIAWSICQLAKTDSAAVVINATHSCMVARGPRSHGSATVTSAMLGTFRESAPLRQEFLQLGEVGR